MIDKTTDRRISSAADDCALATEDVGEDVDISRKVSQMDIDYLKFSLGRDPTGEELKKFQYYYTQRLVGMSAP